MNLTVAEWVAAIERGDKRTSDAPIDMQELIFRELIKRAAERLQIERKDGR